MRSPRASTVSEGGRRTVRVPLGNETVRKIAASISEWASMLRSQSGRAARAASMPAAMVSEIKEVLNSALRENFNLHLLSADVVSDILCRNREPVTAGSKLWRNKNFPGTGSFIGVPAEGDRGRALKLRDQRPRGL